MCKRVRRTQWIPGPYVHGNVLEHRVVEHASHSALGSKCVRDQTPSSLLAGRLRSATGRSYCGFLYPGFQHWYEKMCFYNNIFSAEIKSDAVASREYRFRLVYQVIFPWCRWPDNMDHISVRKHKQIHRPDSRLLVKLSNVTWNITQMQFTFSW